MKYHPNSTSQAILQLIHGYLTVKKKSWGLISQKWMLEKLEDWYDMKMSRSTLNYNLALMRQAKLIESVKRHTHDATGAIVCRVTLYKITKTMRRFIRALAMYFRNIGWRNLRHKYAPVPVPQNTTQQDPGMQEEVSQDEIKEFINRLSDDNYASGFSGA